MTPPGLTTTTGFAASPAAAGAVAGGAARPAARRGSSGCACATADSTDRRGASAATGAAAGERPPPAPAAGARQHRAGSPRAAKKAAMRGVVLAVRQLPDHRLVQLLHQRADRVLVALGVVLLLLRREDRPLVEEVRVEARVALARILGLHVEHAPAVAQVVVVPEDRAAQRASSSGPVPGIISLSVEIP